MAWWQPENFEDQKPVYEARARILAAMRRWFEGQGFLEVQTPIMQVMPGADVHIHAYKLENGLYLHNSPELAMKKLLVAGLPKIYQICPVFRREEKTRLHNPEFTMLEWYRTGADYTDIMEDCEQLLRALDVEVFRHNGHSCDPHQAWQRLSVAQAFEDYAGIDLASSLHGLSMQSMDHTHKACDDVFRKSAETAGVSVREDDGWDDVFHAIMAAKIEPHLGMGAPTILYDYPAHMAALAKKRGAVAERFELYICGVELANAFTELTDATEQRARFEADMAEKQRLYGQAFPIDEDFLSALEHGMPEAGGIALGIDRLVMLSCGKGRL